MFALTKSVAIIALVPALLGGALAAQEATKYDAAWNAWYLGDLEQARRLAEELAAADPNDAMAQVLLGHVLDSQGEETADSVLEKAVELGFSDAAVLKLAGDLHASRFGQWVNTENDYLAAAARSEAERLYLRWAEVAPASVLPIQRLAWLRKAAGDADGAIGMLQAAIALDPMADEPHAELWSYLGDALSYDRLASFYEGLSFGELSAAARCRCRNYQGQLLAAKADKLRLDAAAAATRPEALDLLERTRSALAAALLCFEKAALLHPEFAADAARYAAFHRVGIVRVFGEMDDFGAALRAAEEARAAIEAAHAAGSEAMRRDVANLGDALYLAAGGEGGGAERMRALCEFWRWATALVADDPSWWNNYALFARDAGAYQESYQAYCRCIELAPDDVRYVNDTGLILLYHLDTDLARAEELFQQAIALGEAQYAAARQDPEQEAYLRSALGDAMLNLGVLYTKEERFAEAEQAFARLRDFDGGRLDLQISVLQLALARRDIDFLKRSVEEAAGALEKAPADRDALSDLRRLKLFLEQAAPENDDLAELLRRVDALLGAAAEPEDSGAE
ncbi:MAG: hypothetical protein HY812_06690 [Planctomycetes bacterium]|nr:hypothetical protein [Planctomycetota bacterium]